MPKSLKNNDPFNSGFTFSGDYEVIQINVFGSGEKHKLSLRVCI